MPRSIDGHGRVSASSPPPTSTFSPLLGADLGGDARERPRRRARLQRRHAGQRRDHDRAGFGLPPGVDDRAALAADELVVPDPRFGVDRLADRSEQPQRRQIVLLRPLGAPAHERADRGRRRVEDRDAVLLDQRPEAILLRPVGRAFVHQHRRAVGQRAVDDVAVAGDPADVGGAPVDVLVAQIEHQLRGRVGADQIAAGRVDDALGLPGRAGGVEDVEHVLRVHRLGLARERRVLHQLVIPVIAARPSSCTGDRRARRRAARRRRARSTACRRPPRRRPASADDLAAAIAAVGGDQQAALRSR